MSRKKRTTASGSIRESLLDNIHNRELLPSHVAVSAIQGLIRVAEPGDEKLLYELLDCKDKSIAGAALSALSIYYPELPHINDRIVELASTYTQDYEEENDLQTRAIFALERLATADVSMFKKLIEIAEEYSGLSEPSNDYSDPACIPSNVLSTNTVAWETLARLCNDRISGKESIELMWNPHSELSTRIRDRIREKYKAFVGN